MNNMNPLNNPLETKSCGAKLRGKDVHCKNRAVRVGGRCRLHGGNTPKGISSPHYKHGRYSRYLPNHLRDRYTETLNDPELTSLRDEIALLDVQIGDKLSGIYSGKSGAVVNGLRADLELYLAALSTEKGDPPAKGADPHPLLVRVAEIMTREGSTLNVFEQIQPIIEQRRKLADSENRRMSIMNNSFTAEQAIAFVRQLGETVRRHVKDEATLQAICEDFARLSR